jgi:Holliday junction resolvase RusA-like endonuclease
MTITLPLPWTKPPLMTLNEAIRSSNVHAKAAQVRAAKDAVIWSIRATRPPLPTPAGPVHVTLHYRVANYHRRDPDSLAPTLKVCIDALVAEGVLRDDDWQHVRATTCRIHPPTNAAPALWLVLEEDTTHHDPPTGTSIPA